MSHPPSVEPILAVTQHYPAIVPAVDAADRGDWPAVLSLLATLEPSLRCIAVWPIAERLDDEAVATVLKADGAASALSKVVAATGLIEIGWKIRTDKRAKDVSREQFVALHDYLRRAEQLLLKATAQEPGDAVAWTMRLTTARGLELGHNEARRRYGHAAAATPHLYLAQRQLLQQLCPKWSGTWQEMHAFAWECAFSAPPGSVNGALVVDGHYEHCVDLQGSAARVGYLSQPAIQQEVTQAATHSVMHPSFQPRTVGWVWAHNAFAWYWSVVGNQAAAAAHFRQLGDHATKEFWEFGLGGAVSFESNRKRALQGA